DANPGACVRSVDELSAADVDPDVAEAREEDEVAGLELAPRHGDGIRVVVLRDGVVRQRDTHLGVRVRHETRAVEAARALAAEHVRDAEILLGDAHDAAVASTRDRRTGRTRAEADLRARDLRLRDSRGAGCRGLLRLLRSDHVLDLGADGAVEAPLGGKPALDLVALRRARR